MRIRISRGLGMLCLGTALLGGIAAIRSGASTEAVWAGIWPWMAVLAAAGLHELGHTVAAWGAGVRLCGMKLDLFGARMELSGLLSYGQEMAVAAAGPFASFACAALLYPLAGMGEGRLGGAMCGTMCISSLILGIVNLLPVGTLDGGRILRAGVARLWGDRAATGVLRGTTVLFLVLLWLVCAYGLLRGGQFLTGFVFSLCLLWRTAAGEWGRA